MQNVVLLADARAMRERAAHVRRLVLVASDDKTKALLNGFAAELEKQASVLQARAERLERVSNDIGREVAKARRTIAEIKQTLRK